MLRVKTFPPPPPLASVKIVKSVLHCMTGADISLKLSSNHCKSNRLCLDRVIWASYQYLFWTKALVLSISICLENKAAKGFAGLVAVIFPITLAKIRMVMGWPWRQLVSKFLKFYCVSWRQSCWRNLWWTPSALWHVLGKWRFCLYWLWSLVFEISLQIWQICN